jgi:uncharacterized protein (DUF2235 family)
LTLDVHDSRLIEDLGERMPKNIVVLCDGTGNQIERNLSNVLKLFRMCYKDAGQRVYYGSGIGTISSSDAWARARSNIKSVFGLATGYGLDDEILGAYNFICRHFEPGDDIYLFGFSRGAYTARIVAGIIHLVGLLPPNQCNLAKYALRCYKQASEVNDFSIAWQFAKVAGTRRTPIRFLGVWDTVASVIVPRRDRILPQFLTLPYTRTNPSVRTFRHAMALDERRRMFRLNEWIQPQNHVTNPFERPSKSIPQDIKQVWFAGVHADVGGGYPEEESGLAKFPLDWMVQEAVDNGLKVRAAVRRQIGLGQAGFGSKASFVKPDATAMLHRSLQAGWWFLEWLPKSGPREWPGRTVLGRYLPLGEPRLIERQGVRPTLHQSVVDRWNALSKYRPRNYPASYDVEP